MDRKRVRKTPKRLSRAVYEVRLPQLDTARRVQEIPSTKSEEVKQDTECDPLRDIRNLNQARLTTKLDLGRKFVSPRGTRSEHPEILLPPKKRLLKTQIFEAELQDNLEDFQTAEVSKNDCDREISTEREGDSADNPDIQTDRTDTGIALWSCSSEASKHDCDREISTEREGHSADNPDIQTDRMDTGIGLWSCSSEASNHDCDREISTEREGDSADNPDIQTDRMDTGIGLGSCSGEVTPGNEEATQERSKCVVNDVGTDVSAGSDPDAEDLKRRDFTFCLSTEEWQSIHPETGKPKDRLTGNWTALFASKIAQHLPHCTWVFKLNRIKKHNSRKQSAPYFRSKAHCTRKGCTVSLLISLNHKPISKAAQFSLQVFGKKCHTKEQAKRQLKGIERAKVASKADRSGVMNFYYDRLSEITTEQISEGDITHCQTPAILRKAVSEWVQKELLHRDLVQEVLLLKQAYVDNEDGKPTSSYPGFIQSVGADPFTVIMFGKEQLGFIKSHPRADFFLDATGSVIRSIPGQRKPLLYSLVVQPESGPPLSVGDMITTDHSIPSILHFLMIVKRVTACLNCWLQPRKLETDWSWAEIQSGLIAFNNQNLKRYLSTCWKICHGDIDRISEFTVHHICTSHMTKAFRGAITVFVKNNKELTEFLMKGFVSLCNETCFHAAKETFRNICQVLLSLHTHDHVVSACKQLNQLPSTSVEEETEVIPRDEVSKISDKTIVESSPWFDAFVKVKTQVSRNLTPKQQGHLNPSFCPDVVEVILTKYLSIFPLWSGILLGPLNRYTCTGTSTLSSQHVTETRASNAPVESWFKTIKIDILQKKAKLRPAVLISKIKKSVNGRMAEAQNLDILRPKIRKRKTDLLETGTEGWSRKPARRRRNRYHPEKGKQVTKEWVEKDDTLPSVPSWGGKFQGKPLVNTCTVDNFLAVLRVSDFDNSKLRDACQRHSHHKALMERVLESLDFMRASNFSAAKMTWAARHNVSGGSTIDLYGSEMDVFGHDFVAAVRSRLTTRCSSPQCPDIERTRTLRGISLNCSATDVGREIHSISDMMQNWTSPEPTACFAQAFGGDARQDVILDEEGRARGTSFCAGRRYGERQLEEPLPPVLILTVSDHVQMGNLPTDPRKLSLEVCLYGAMYGLSGVTLHHHDHFTCAIYRPRRGWFFYDGLAGHLTRLEDSHLLNTTPSQAVYIVT